MEVRLPSRVQEISLICSFLFYPIFFFQLEESAIIVYPVLQGKIIPVIWKFLLNRNTAFQEMLRGFYYFPNAFYLKYVKKKKEVNMSLYQFSEFRNKEVKWLAKLIVKDKVKGRMQKQNFIPALTALHITAKSSKSPESN